MQQSPYALPRLNLTTTCATGYCSDARVVVDESLKRMGGTYRGIGPNLSPLHHLAEVGSVCAVGEVCADVCGVGGVTVVGAAAMRVRVAIQVQRSHTAVRGFAIIRRSGAEACEERAWCKD